MDFLEELEKTKLIEERIEANRKLKEQLKNDSSLVPEKTENLLKKYNELTPLNFVNTIETLYHTIIHNTKFDSLHTLSAYKASHNVKFDLLDFELKQKVSAKISKKMKDINCFKIADKYLFTGENDGSAHMYLIEKGEERRNFNVPQFNSPVSVIENNNADYLLVGYYDGTINLFDINKGNLMHSIKEIHKTKIIALKFANVEKNSFTFISTDEEGQVMDITYSSKLKNLKKNTSNELIFKDTEAVYAITKFKPNTDENKSLLGFSSANKVRLYTLEPKLELIFELNKPDYIEENDIPDISLGWGNRPQPKSTKKKLSEGIANKEIFFAVAWGHVISFYVITSKGDKYIPEGPIGYFENNISIIRLGFISASIIYFFDKTAQLKIINTSFCDFGKYEKIEDKKFEYNKNALIDEGKILDPHMKKNNISKKKENKYYSYRNFIYNMKKSIYLFTNDGLRIGKVLGYEDCLEDIINKSNNWFGAMCLAIDIYQGNITSFPEVPTNEKKRKEKLDPYLTIFLNKYIEYKFKGSKESNDKGLDEDVIDMRDDEIIECINVTIEFCIGIKMYNFLFKEVEKIFNKYGKKDLFYKLLEPFIFNDLLIKDDLSEEILTLLYRAYKSKNELALLSHLFIHINIRCLNNFAMKKLAVTSNLYSLIIFLFSNGKCYEDFFLPITKMFYSSFKENATQQKKEEENNNEIDFFNYSEIYGEKGIKGINEMERCREYIGHKLLWYIEQCLKGKKYASEIEVDLLKFNMYSDNYKNFIATIYFWVLQEKIFLLFLNFDSYSFFSILNLFFTEPKIMKIIQEYNFSQITADKLQKLIDEQENNAYFMKEMANLQNEIINESNEKKDTKKEIPRSKTQIEKIPQKESEKKKKQTPKESETKDKDKEEKSKETKESTETNDTPKEESNKDEMPTPINDTDNDNEKEEIDPFATSAGQTQFGKGVKLNDLNSVLLYIINVTESQNGFFSHQDLDTFLIRFASKYQKPSNIPEIVRAKIFEGFKNCLTFFSDYKNIRNDLINNKEDKFNCHSLAKESIDINDFYFKEISKCLLDLLDSEIYKFNNDELNELIRVASRTPFTMVKIKIAELSKNYSECLNIYFQNKTEKLQDDVFSWLDKNFLTFNEILEEEKLKAKEEEKSENEKDKAKDKEKEKTILPEMKDRATIAKENRLNMLREDLHNLRTVVIDQIGELAKMRLDKTNKLVGKYFSNVDKLNIIEKLQSTPELQFEFLNQLLNPLNPSYEIVAEDNEKYNAYFEILNLFKKLNSQEKENVRDKIINEQFKKILIQQIKLLINLKRTNDILRFLKINIKLYPNYPLQEVLEECMNNNITDSAIFLYQTLGESKKALDLTLKSLDKAFYNYLQDDEYDDKTEFEKKLNICIDICIENSESLSKNDFNDEGKESGKEGEDLWFNLLENLYKYEDEFEKDEIKIEGKEEAIKLGGYRKNKILNNLQKCIEELLKKMCLYVSIQNLVDYVTESQNRAQYKEFKCILESMLRTNTSFDRVLNSTMTILKRAINNSENERKKVTLKGNNYNYTKCDVCHEYFENSKTEVVLCFGCGHQSHKSCCYKKKNNGEDESNDENFKPECLICYQNEIENENTEGKGDDKKGQEKYNILEDINEFRASKIKEKSKKFRFGNKNEKLKKMMRYDKLYENEMTMFN